MESFITLESILFVVFVAFLSYQVGKIRGRELESKQNDLQKRIDLEADSERRTKLLLEWNELSDGPGYLKRNFKKIIQKNSKSKR